MRSPDCTETPQSLGSAPAVDLPARCAGGVCVLRRCVPSIIAASPTSAPRLGSPRPHLHRDWAHPAHIFATTGLTPPTSAPALPGAEPTAAVRYNREMGPRVAAHPRGSGALPLKLTVFTPPVVRPKTIPPHPRCDWAHPCCHIRAATGLTPAATSAPRLGSPLRPHLRVDCLRTHVRDRPQRIRGRCTPSPPPCRSKR